MSDDLSGLPLERRMGEEEVLEGDGRTGGVRNLGLAVEVGAGEEAKVGGNPLNGLNNSMTGLCIGEL